MHLNTGDVWKYGESTNITKRYSRGYLENRRVRVFEEFSGSQRATKAVEKAKIFGYFFTHGHLPPGNKIMR